MATYPTLLPKQHESLNLQHLLIFVSLVRMFGGVFMLTTRAIRDETSPSEDVELNLPLADDG